MQGNMQAQPHFAIRLAAELFPYPQSGAAGEVRAFHSLAACHVEVNWCRL